MSRGHREGATFSSRTPHFFKIILDETLREKRLLIPKKFVRLYGDTLSSSVSIKLPCDYEWKMKLIKHEGRVWLGKGWTKFAEHYSIVRGHMLSFSYKGNSKFEAVIFDTSTVEIDYPFVTRHFDESDIDDKKKVHEDDSVENLDDFPPCPSTRKKFQSPCSRPRKRMRASPVAKPQINLSHAKPEGSHHNKTVFQKSVRKGNSRNSMSEMRGKQDLPSKHVGRKSSTKSCRVSEIIRFVKPLDRRNKTAALEKASGFTSDRPFFKVVMQPYYVHGHLMNVPAYFARRYLKNKSVNAFLQVANGRRKTWPMKHSFVVSSGKSVARLNCGWKKFARDNNLEVGDICVFVLLKGIKVSFEVVIFRVNGNSRPPNSSATRVDQHDKTLRYESESGIAIENRTSVPSSCDDIPVKQENRSASFFHKTSLDMEAIGRQQSLSTMEKARLLERARFFSEKPFFKAIVQPSYTSGGSHMPIPLDIARKYFKNEGDIVLRVPNTGSWSVGFKVWHLRSGRFMAELHSGWKAFAEGNNLKAGDVCIFELVDETEISFEVSIVRIPDDNAYCQQSQALRDPEENDSESCGAMNNETRTPNSRTNLRLKQARRYMSTSGKTSLKPEATSWQKALTVIEKNKFLERARFESQKPFFKVVIQPSYTGVGNRMPVPNDFAWKYIKEDRDAILHVPNGTSSWPAQLKMRPLVSGRVIAEFSKGWREFSEGNNLEVGDVCIFELMNATGISFEVSIVRAAIDDACHWRYQAGESSTSLDKSKGHVSVKIEVD